MIVGGREAGKDRPMKKNNIIRAALEEMVRVFAAYEEFPVETKALAAARAALKKSKAQRRL